MSSVMHIRYDKMADTPIAADAYSILSNKTRHKVEYITNAIEHANEYEYLCKQDRDVLFVLRCLKFIKNYYGIDSVEKLEGVLASDTVLQKALEWQLEPIKPKPSFLRFKEEGSEAEVYEYLMAIPAAARMSLMFTSVRQYVYDGMDSGMLMKLTYRFLCDSIREYQTEEHKTEVVEAFYRLLQSSGKYSELF